MHREAAASTAARNGGISVGASGVSMFGDGGACVGGSGSACGADGVAKKGIHTEAARCRYIDMD